MESKLYQMFLHYVDLCRLDGHPVEWVVYDDGEDVGVTVLDRESNIEHHISRPYSIDGTRTYAASTYEKETGLLVSDYWWSDGGSFFQVIDYIRGRGK